MGAILFLGARSRKRFSKQKRQSVDHSMSCRHSHDRQGQRVYNGRFHPLFIRFPIHARQPPSYPSSSISPHPSTYALLRPPANSPPFSFSRGTVGVALCSHSGHDTGPSGSSPPPSAPDIARWFRRMSGGHDFPPIGVLVP